MEKCRKGRKFLSDQFNSATDRLLRRLDKIWAIGGSLDLSRNYLGESEALITWMAFITALWGEHIKIESQLSDKPHVIRLSACKFITLIIFSNITFISIESFQIFLRSHDDSKYLGS